MRTGDIYISSSDPPSSLPGGRVRETNSAPLYTTGVGSASEFRGSSAWLGGHAGVNTAIQVGGDGMSGEHKSTRGTVRSWLHSSDRRLFPSEHAR